MNKKSAWLQVQIAGSETDTVYSITSHGAPVRVTASQSQSGFSHGCLVGNNTCPRWRVRSVWGIDRFLVDAS